MPQMIRRPNQKNPRLTLGAGLGQGTPNADIVALMKSATSCPIYALPTVAKVQWEFEGPITNAAVTQTLGNQISLLGSGTSPNGVDNVYSTDGLINGEFQTYVLACAIGVHLEPEPMCWTAQGNAIPTPGSSIAMPNSPDNYSVNDQTNLVYGGATQSAPQVQANMRRALLQWGWWVNYGFWHLARGYNLRWTYGSLINIMDEQLRDTAYTPPAAQEGSASSSQVSIVDFVNRVNARYTDPTKIGGNKIFLWQNLVRVGTLGAQTTSTETQGKFRPFDDVIVDATYGGMDLRSMLKGNSEFRTLEQPYILKPGVPPGLIFEANNNNAEVALFRQQFDATGGFGGTPPYAITPSQALIAQGAGATFDELSADNVDVLQTQNTEHYVFKGGTGLMSVEIKGYEITEPLADQIKGDAVLQAQICSECGCAVGWAS
jgi:hypothetical protein